ncbi:MAG: ABC-F family ATP-binding cassette domain-containing protein [Treponema sp.]|nr:ABC-F family ATP-binding cassette domain-containing protein [Treponema sp.]
MNILSVSNLKKIGREDDLFVDVTFGLNEGEKAAIIGRNGSGKSTLLSIIAGKLQPEDGNVYLNKACGLSYLPQNPKYNNNDTIRQHIFSGTGSKLEIIKEYETICEKMQDGFTDNLQNEYDKIVAIMDERNLWNYENDIQSILTTLGISNLKQKMNELSGGMIKKVALAKVLVDDTNLLLLDEPTNHLDIKTITWLENYLKNTKKTVLMVTHDRYFLDKICSTMYEIERKKIKRYDGNYSEYLEKKVIEAEIEKNTDRRIESVLRTERDWLMRGPCARGTKAKARTQNIHKMINREKFAQDKGFNFEVTGRRLGGKVLEVQNLNKSYKTATSKIDVIQDFSYIFSGGEKIGIYGNNGSGKTTLLNLLTQTIMPNSGTIIKGENTLFGYYMQNPILATKSQTVLEYVKEAAEVITLNNGKTLSASQLLDSFGYEGKIQYSDVSTLSGGEKKKLYLVRLLMSNPNFLILDEPTNDFDIFTMSIMESFLQGYKGCLLVVSHDRYFMDKVCDTLFVLDGDGGVSGYVGKCSELIEEMKKDNSLLQTEKTDSEKQNDVTKNLSEQTKEKEKAQKQKPRKLTYKEQQLLKQLETDIFALEERKEELDFLFNSGETDYEKLTAYGNEYAKIETELEQKYAQYETLI